MSATDHWFDRLTERITRRDALRAAAVTGAVAVLPAARTSTASARVIIADRCFPGCFWFARQTKDKAIQKCASTTAGSYFALGLAYEALTGPLGIITAQGPAVAIYDTCEDKAVLQLQQDSWNCVKPNCDNFDPTQPGGPCDTCEGGASHCCTCPQSQNGYICCFYDCGDSTPGHNCCG